MKNCLCIYGTDFGVERLLLLVRNIGPIALVQKANLRHTHLITITVIRHYVQFLGGPNWLFNYISAMLQMK